MMELKALSGEQIQNFFLSDPNVSYLGLADENLESMYREGKYLQSDTSYILGIYNDGELIALFKWELFTLQTINIHLFISTKYQKQGNMTNIFNHMHKHLLEKTEFEKVITMVPSPCEHVWKPLEHLGFTREANLTKCLKWRQAIVDMFIYSINLDRGNT